MGEAEDRRETEPMSAAAMRRGETELERIDRNLEELMAELRVALPGVQVLFAFLLILPFNARFAEASEFEKGLFLGTLACTAFASLFLIAPTLHHRLQFRADRKERILRHAQALALTGLALLAVAMCGATALVCHFVFGTAAAIAVTAPLAIVFGVVWYLLPLRGPR